MSPNAYCPYGAFRKFPHSEMVRCGFSYFAAGILLQHRRIREDRPLEVPDLWQVIVIKLIDGA